MISAIVLILCSCANVAEADIITDDAYVLLDDQKTMKMYKEFNEELLKTFDIDFRVITVSNNEDIDIFSNKEFTRLQKESRSKSGKALLLVINTLQDKIRLEVSMALEPIYTDAFVSYIERKGFVPYFRDNKIADGIYMATALSRDRAFEASEGKEFMPPMESKSIGGGAKTDAPIGQKDPDAKQGDNILANVGETPMNVLKKYLVAIKKHNKNPNLDIYTGSTKEFFKKWTVTEINQDNEVKFLSPCMDNKKTYYSQDDNYAVMLNDPVERRKCSPYFFKKEQGKWKLDFATMSRILRFNVDMLWHFDKKERLKGEGIYYAFAFDGLTFDKNGYPFHPKKPKTDDMRWGFQCSPWYYPEDEEKIKTEPDKYVRCWIRIIWRGSPAEVRLGLETHDYIHAIGEGVDYKENITTADFMQYMKSVPSGQMVTVVIRRNNRELVVRQGIAP